MSSTKFASSPRHDRDRAGAHEQAVASAAVGMGQIAILTPDGVGHAVLGSCVGLTLHDTKLGYAAIAHIVLPSSENRTGTVGKFADTAIDHMLEQLRALGAEPARLTAKLAGGASMFETKGPFQIGKQNVEAVLARLAAKRVRTGGEHVGGVTGRRITFECRTGRMLVEVLGADPIVL